MTKRPKKKQLRSSSVDKLFRDRAERFRTHCGWCDREIGEDEPVFGIDGKAHPGMDLSRVQGKVIEMTLETTGKRLLTGVCAFDSDAKRAGKDFMFMVCSNECGKKLQGALREELASRGSGG